MLVINIYRWRDDSHDVESGRRIMEAFAARGESPDTVAHYVFADGTGGVVITDGDSYRMKDAKHRKERPTPT